MLTQYNGRKIKIYTNGSSHSKIIDSLIIGLPPKTEINLKKLNSFLDRRKPDNSIWSTKRKENDRVNFIKGVIDNKIISESIKFQIKNNDTKPENYKELKYTPRPGHADFSAYSKFGYDYDMSGGGEFSGRMTLPLCVVGGISKQILTKLNIHAGVHIYQISDVKDEKFDPVKIDIKKIQELEKKFPLISEESKVKMIEKINEAKKEGNSLGGIVEAAVIGVKAGIGGLSIFGLESIISSLIFSIPGVKGIEFGNGFECCEKRGSENNDEFCIKNKNVQTITNNSGGILGGISNGMPIIIRVAFKPTPSIAKEQKTVNLKIQKETKIKIKGRHDACFVPRAAVIVEACLSICILDTIIAENPFAKEQINTINKN